MAATPADRKLAKAAKAANDLFAALGVALSAAEGDTYDKLDIEYNEAAKIATSLNDIIANLGA